jgi:hypothetical protein
MTFAICDAAGIVQDISSQEANLSRGLPYLKAGGRQYRDVPAGLDLRCGDLLARDKAGKYTHVPDAKAREAEAAQGAAMAAVEARAFLLAAESLEAEGVDLSALVAVRAEKQAAVDVAVTAIARPVKPLAR